MPLYEYFCSGCSLRFELLRPISEVNRAASCPECQVDAERIPSTFSHHNAATYPQKTREDMAEKMMAIEQRREREPALNPDKWLEQVKKEKVAEKEFKKEIERDFGREADAPLKYAAAKESEKRRRREDPWAA